jgi:carbon storage regulator CsrA
MLVLTRKYQEKIRIGNNITITVLRTKGKAVRLGIEAPADVPVIRGELAFDSCADAGEVDGSACDAIPASESASAPCRDRQSSLKAAWTTELRPDRAARKGVLPSTRVDMRRVPRENVSDVLPSLVPGGAPLRAMLDRRTVV